MNLRGRTAALYGRFSPGAREALAAEIVRRGGAVARDLTRRSDFLIVGAFAYPSIDTGRISARIGAARARATPVVSERRFGEILRGAETDAATLPLSSVKGAGLPRATIEILAAFDVVRLEGENCRFADAAALKSATDLIASGRTPGETVRILTEVRDRAPAGRRRVVLDGAGRAALQWESGLTRLDGQGYLPFEGEGASIDDLFEDAATAEVEGDLDEAARLYERAARADRSDPIAPFNLGAVRLAAERHGEAALAFRQAIARDPNFVEARYNLAVVSEKLGKFDLAREQLGEALEIEPGYSDARFNLAQLDLKRGALAEAKMHFERYLAEGPPPEWAEKARRAIQYCAAALSA